MKIFSFLFLFVILIFLVTGCGSASSSSSSSSGSSSDTIALTGTLSLGTVNSLSTKFATAASDYAIVAVDNENQKTYRAVTSTDGAFSLSVPSEGTYLVSLLNDGSYIGPVVFDGSGTEVSTGITPTDATDLGAITVDATTGYARTDNAPDVVASSVTAVASSGIPVGAGNDGKTEQAGITNRSDSDKDKDGIPNLFDADEDNDGIRNGITSTPSGATVESDRIETVQMNSNIWADHDTTEEAKDLIALRLHVIPKSGQEDTVASVQCIDVPASISSVATVRFASSLGDPVDYPTENSLWSDAGYGLYKTTTLDPEEWIISINPHAVMSVGDTFTIRVTYTDATTEDFFLNTSYVLTDWARISTYNGTTLTTDVGTSTDPVEITTSSLEIVFTKPVDEDGNILEGLTYSLIYGESDCTGGICSVATERTEDSVTDTGAETVTHTITLPTNATYYITPVASSSDGQRNGEETWFKKE